jgi:hypothetical protein
VRQETLGHKPAAAASSALGMTGVYTHTTPAFHRSEIQRALRLRTPSLELATAHASGGECVFECGRASRQLERVLATA